jgi:hypothetical protein
MPAERFRGNRTELLEIIPYVGEAGMFFALAPVPLFTAFRYHGRLAEYRFPERLRGERYFGEGRNCSGEKGGQWKMVVARQKQVMMM